MKNELAVRDPANDLVKSLEGSFGQALPTHLTQEHFARALLTEFRRTPGLLECTRESIAAGVVSAAQMGLMLGVNGAAWLLPFKKEATLIIGYQGLVDLCYRSDRIDSVFADVVCENDEFEFEQGLMPRLRHIPYMRGPRGDAYAVYATAQIKGSVERLFVLMTKDEVMKVKAASPGSGSSRSPWNGPFEYEMWKKSALRRICKLLPKSIELATALQFEQEHYGMREVEANVVDETLAPKKRNTRIATEAVKRGPGRPRKQKQPDPESPTIAPEPEPEPPAVDQVVEPPIEEPCDAYIKLEALYNRTPGMVKKACQEVGQNYGIQFEKFSEIDAHDEPVCTEILEAAERIRSRAKGE